MMQTQLIAKRSLFLFLALLSIHFVGLGQNTTTPYRMKTVVVDAGHGGKDPGNLGTGRYKAKEKDIALDVALRVGGYIEKQFPEIKVVYTRSTDVFIGLDERTEIANKAKADLFISIHCNAFQNPNSNGVETFVLGLHRNKENLQVAMKENSAIFLEDDYKTKYEGFDPNSAESIIALTIMQSAYLQQSLSISAYIQNQFKSRVGRRDRGVKQAGFLVLRKTTMPSILIELGFLTNPAEEDFLNSENGKAYMSSAIFRGFKDYKELVEDPLPEGSEVGEKENQVKESTNSTEKKSGEETEAINKAKEKAKQDSIQNAKLNQAKLKAVADSLEQVKKNLLEEKQRREAELQKVDKAKLKARVDSLEAVKAAKIEALEKEMLAIAAKKKQEEAELKAKEEAEKKAAIEEARKELEAKEEAKKWLEEIKEVKKEELEEAKQQAETEKEKARLLAIKKQKEKELEDARRLAEQQSQKTTDSLNASKLREEQARIDSLAKATEAQNRARKDSIAQAAQLAIKKAKQDSLAAAKKAESKKEVVTINDEKATTAEEAELLFLQLRKRQLEQRIAQLKGQDVKEVTAETLEKRAALKPEAVGKPDNKVVPGLVFKVQVITSSKQLAKDNAQFRGQQVWEYQQGGLYKYTVGDTRDFEEITKLQGELRSLGFQGAFVVAFEDGERIKVSEAREMLNE